MDTLAIIKRIEMRLSQIGMSKAEFYRKSGISSASFSQWRTGTYNPSKKKLSKAAEVLSVSVGYLTGDVTLNDDGYSFSDGSGYGGGLASGAGFGDGTGYGGPMPRKDKEKAPTVSDERIDMNDVDVAFYGDFKELSDDDKATIRDMVRIMRQRRATKQ